MLLGSGTLFGYAGNDVADANDQEGMAGIIMVDGKVAQRWEI